MEYYYQNKEGVPQGPFSGTNLVELINSREIDGETQIKQGSGGSWQALQQVSPSILSPASSDVSRNQSSSSPNNLTVNQLSTSPINNNDTQGAIPKRQHTRNKSTFIIISLSLIIASAGVAYHYGKLDNLISYLKSEGSEASALTELNGMIVDSVNVELRGGIYYQFNHKVPYTGIIESYYFDSQKEWQRGVINGLTSGRFIMWDHQGNPILELEYIKGLKNGPIKKWNSDGSLKLTGHYKNDKLHGTILSYHANQQIAESSEYKNGAKEGNQITYSKRGVKLTDFNFKNDLLQGTQKTWSQRGLLLTKTYYSEGQKEGDSYNYYDNGATRSVTSYKKGVRSGYSKLYTGEGVLKETVFYLDGEVIKNPLSHSNLDEPQPIIY